MRDAKAWQESGLAKLFQGRLLADGGPGGFADTAYHATGLTPRRKPPDNSAPNLRSSSTWPSRPAAPAWNGLSRT
jgi:hypothetical protein